MPPSARSLSLTHSFPALFPLLGFPSLLFGFPGGSDGKESVCNSGYMGLIPGLRRSLGEGNGYPLQYSCLENSMDSGAWLQSTGFQRIRHN